jgi:Bacterial Ig-like domain
MPCSQSRFGFHTVLAFTLICMLCSCAREIMPTGGPSDKEPPKVVADGTTPNLQRNFKKSDIVYRFDEWLQLKDATNQVFISPPTTKKPQVKLSGKRVIVSFDEAEVLRPNTTYTIHFGNSVQDLNEGNAVKDMRFVFSTGESIDSLGLRGKVADALTGLPSKGISVALYTDTNDSVAVKALPDYLAFTDEAGQYQIQNVHEGSYRMVAFKDDNKNNKWSHPQELVAFGDSLVQVLSSNTEAPVLALFKTELPLRLVNKDVSSFGLVKLQYGTDASGLALDVLSDSVSIKYVQRQRDSVLVWYDHQRTTPWLLRCGTDTIEVRPGNRADFLALHSLTWAGAAPATSGVKSSRNRAAPVATTPTATIPVAPRPTQALTEITATRTRQPVFPMAYPIERTDTTRWICQRVQDSTQIQTYSVAIDSLNPTRINISLPAVAGTILYKFTLLPGAITDVWGTINRDTLTASVRVFAGEETGNLNLTIDALIPNTDYLIELKDGGGVIVAKERFRSETKDKKLSFDALVPGSFTAIITKDSNANGFWDSGDYFQKRQPEQIWTQIVEGVRPNWSVDVQITLDTAGKKAKGGGKKI